MSDAHLSQLTFDSLNIPESLKRGIAELGFTRCTPIQAQTLPVALAGRDVAGQAQTGTGQDRGVSHRAVQPPVDRPRRARTGRSNAPRAIVIAPTRELAVQIHSDALGIGKYTGLKLAIVFGGVDYEKQRRILEEGVDVLIGTPGRIIDYFKQHVFDLRHIQVAVLDEADRMFDLGFIKDIRFILRRLPHPTHAPEHDVFGDFVASRARTRLRAHEQSRADPHRAGQDDGRPRDARCSTSPRPRRRSRC